MTTFAEDATIETSLADHIEKVEKILITLQRRERAVSGLRILLGKALLEFQIDFYKVYGRRSPFYRWAAKRFNRNERTLKRYASYAKNPEKMIEEDKASALRKKDGRRKANWLNRFKSAFQHLSTKERLEALLWLEAEITTAEALERKVAGIAAKFTQGELPTL